MKTIEKKITSIINWFKKAMEEYEEVYRDVYKDPNFMAIEGRTFRYGIF